MNIGQVLVFAAAMLIALAIGWAIGYRQRHSGSEKSTHLTEEALAQIKPEFMAELNAEIDEETERYLWQAVAKGPGYRVWRSDPQLVDGKLVSAFKILEPEESPPPGQGTVFSWT